MTLLSSYLLQSGWATLTLQKGLQFIPAAVLLLSLGALLVLVPGAAALPGKWPSSLAIRLYRSILDAIFVVTSQLVSSTSHWLTDVSKTLGRNPTSCAIDAFGAGPSQHLFQIDEMMSSMLH